MLVSVFKTSGFSLVACTISKREFWYSLVSGTISSRSPVIMEQMEGKTKTKNDDHCKSC